VAGQISARNGGGSGALSRAGERTRTTGVDYKDIICRRYLYKETVRGGERSVALGAEIRPDRPAQAGANGSLLTRRWRGESRANQSLKWVFRGPGELRSDSNTFMDDVGSLGAPFRGGSAGIVVFVPRLGSPAMSF
jgi:hypothetical protein